MYCSSCGNAVTPGLIYCNRCGAELGAKERGATSTSEASADSLVWAIVVVAVGGLGAIMVLLAVMKEVFGKELLAAFTLLGFLLLFAAEGIFIRLLLRRRDGLKEAADTARLKEPKVRELGAAQTRMIAEGAPGLAEPNTRTPEPAYRKRETQ